MSQKALLILELIANFNLEHGSKVSPCQLVRINT